MSDKQQARIVSLQRQVKIARGAMLRIAHGCRNPEGVAQDAMDEMWKDGVTQSLQALVGHERRAP